MRIIIIALTILFFVACKDNVHQPKPHAYPRFYYPKKEYVKFDTSAPYSFLYPSYAVVLPYSEDDMKNHPFWYNINYLPFNATLHISYHTFDDRAGFDDLFEETRKLVYKHDIKAEEISQYDIVNPKTNSTGIIYELKGNTATNLNFYVSDGQKHFVRGALYFNAKTQIDSIQPMFDFLKQDVLKMIETTTWKK